MRGKQAGLVISALIVLVVIGLVARVVSTAPAEKPLSGVSPLSSETIDRLVVEDFLSVATLRKEGDLWMVGPYPAAQWLLDALWETAAQLEGADLIATNSVNHPYMGVTFETGSLVQFWRGDQLVEEFMIGDRSVALPVRTGEPARQWTQEAQQCYVRRPTEPEVYGVFCAEGDRFLPVDTWWTEPIILQVTPQQIQSMTFEYPDSSYRLEKITGIEWTLVDGEEVEANLTKTVDVTERFRQLVTEAFATEEEMTQADFDRPDAVVTMVLEDAETGDTRQLRLVFLRKDDDFYYVKHADTPWAYQLTATSTSAILRDRDWFLTPLLRAGRPATTTAP